MRRTVLLAAVLATAVAFTACGDDGDPAGGGDVAEDLGADAVSPPEDAADDGGDDADEGPGDTAAPDTAPADTAPPAPVCPPGLTGCVGGDLLVCNETGSAFELETCDEGLLCADGACVECGGDGDCAEGLVCEEGTCVAAPLAVVTTALPPVMEDAAFEATLEATGGVPPYAWSLSQGQLPSGVTLAADGVVSGASGDVGTWPFIVRVTDDAGEKATAPLSLKILGNGLQILTPDPLPLATDGEPYSVTFEAAGGKAPYFWGLAGGSLPAGLGLGADGVLAGVPSGDGTYQVKVKVFDDALPPLVATETFNLSVTIAPLEIIADQQIDLFVTKVIVLPLIIVVNGIPVPYNAKLQAKGGKKPYHWSAQPLPGLVQGLIPKAGLPQGLTLADDGTISGAVTDPSLAVSVTVPFTGIELKGFFFAAQVEDDQPVPYDASALYIIPTIPLGG